MLTGERARGRQLFRGSLEDDGSTVVAGSRSQIDHPIGMGNDCKMVFYDNHGVSLVHHFIQQSQEPVHICHVQARGWLIQYVDSLAFAQIDG